MPVAVVGLPSIVNVVNGFDRMLAFVIRAAGTGVKPIAPATPSAEASGNFPEILRPRFYELRFRAGTGVGRSGLAFWYASCRIHVSVTVGSSQDRAQSSS